MPTSRVLLKQGDLLYRFVRFETSSDGSLVILMDRDARSKRGSMRGALNVLDPSAPITFTADEVFSDEPLQSFKFTAHTTGLIHRYASGKREGTIQIEPLHSLTRLATFGIISIPLISRLDSYDEGKHLHAVAPVLEFPDNFFERLTFAIELGPKPQEPKSFGVALNYELYSVVVRIIQNPKFPSDVANHFISAMADTGLQNKINKVEAELQFYQRIHGRTPFVFREDKGGAYVAMAIAPMVKPPKLTIGFSRPDLRIEIIPFEGEQPNHKIRFWICDKGGRNKTDDLRQYITSVEFDARL